MFKNNITAELINIQFKQHVLIHKLSLRYEGEEQNCFLLQ